MSFTTLFENEDFILVDKEAGVLSVPARTGKADPRPVLGLLLQEKLGKQIFPVHRLDFEVSGCLLFAKNSKAHHEANQAFENHLVQKTYEALSLSLSEFEHSRESYRWQCKLLRGKKRAYESPVGKDSTTEGQVIEALSWQQQTCLRWQLKPITGRSHQLRYEMYRHKVPIIGDALYGSSVLVGKNAIALRAVGIDFRAAHEKSLLKSLPPQMAARPLMEWIRAEIGHKNV